MESAEQRGLWTVLLALGLRRNATIGTGVGLLLASGAYLYRVVIATRLFGARSTPLLFLLLGFVLAATTAALVTIALTIVAAVRAARDLDSDTDPA
ncbi:MAG: hypothetical protein R3324_12810 [Halobacteriales archaeon]|nr:hypothetical protein [Halobacteriales archaeon]